MAGAAECDYLWRYEDAQGLTATSLGYETDYHKIGEYAGGLGMVVRTPMSLGRQRKRVSRLKSLWS